MNPLALTSVPINCCKKLGCHNNVVRKLGLNNNMISVLGKTDKSSSKKQYTAH